MPKSEAISAIEDFLSGESHIEPEKPKEIPVVIPEPKKYNHSLIKGCFVRWRKFSHYSLVGINLQFPLLNRWCLKPPRNLLQFKKLLLHHQQPRSLIKSSRSRKPLMVAAAVRKLAK